MQNCCNCTGNKPARMFDGVALCKRCAKKLGKLWVLGKAA